MRIRNDSGVLYLLFFAVLISAASSRPEDRITKSSRLERRRLIGENPAAISQNRGSNFSNVKKSKKAAAPPFPESGSWARESSMIQAYGMPKRGPLESNGEIERLNLDRVSGGLDGKVEKVNFGGGGISAYGMPKRNQPDNGFIEREFGSKKKSENLHRLVRSSETIRDENEIEDLEAQEAKVFRPLFVYRQQIADRYRIEPRKNPIYGAYNYGRNDRHRNFGYGYK